jgi:hypothetical protein
MEKRLRLDEDDRLLLLESLYLYCHKYPERWEARGLAQAVMDGHPGRRSSPYSVQLYTIKEWIAELRARDTHQKQQLGNR